MRESQDRRLQLKTYSDILQPIKGKKSIDIDMEIESFFKNLYIHPDSNQYRIIKLYHEIGTDEFCFEYDFQYEKLMSLGCSNKVKVMFENLGITEKKSFRFITRMMNRHHNISKVNRVFYFSNW